MRKEICEDCGVGLIPYVDETLSCSCHIFAPCGKCCSEMLICPECDEMYGPEDEHIKQPVYVMPTPRCDINSGVSYTTTRSWGWVRVEGTFRKGMTSTEVKNLLGKFDKYHMFLMEWFSNGDKDEFGRFRCTWCTD